MNNHKPYDPTPSILRYLKSHGYDDSQASSDGTIQVRTYSIRPRPSGGSELRTTVFAVDPTWEDAHRFVREQECVVSNAPRNW